MDKELLNNVLKLKSELKIKVLYVEDNEVVREGTAELLKEFFYTVETASNGLEGLEKFKKDKFDIVITDINMPKMNGIEMIKEIKKLDKRIPIIVITAFSDFKYIAECIKIGVYGYILKPIDINQLLEVISTVLEKIKLRKERDKALQLLEQYKKIIDESATVTKTDPKGFITYANDKFCEKSGYSREELIGKPHNIVRHPDMPPSAFKEMWDTIQSKRTWHGLVKNRTKDGKAVYMKATIAPILDENGEIVEYIAVRHDVTEYMNPKRLLQDKIRELKKPLLLYCKIEDYDDLENFYDADTMEELEEKFINMAPALFPPGCKFMFSYNLGNGEFAFLKEYDSNKPTNKFLEELKEFQENVRKTPIKFKDYEQHIEVVLSFATKKEHIIENAKMGIKRALERKVDIIFADGLVQEMKKIAKENIETLILIKEAIENNRVVSYFQPIFNNKTKKIEKYESLVRIKDRNDNIVPPYKFLSVAKISRYYKQITKIMTEKTINAIEKLHMEISLNLSEIDIEDGDTVNFILNKLKENPGVAERLVIELLEDANINNQAEIKKFIKNIKSMGVKIAIDDFGSGYSNFVRLLEYEPDYIKIDASLIRDIETNPNSFNIVETIKNFADKQGFKTVAEFVENENILRIVTELGIDYSQGYYIGKPEEIEA